MNAELLYYVSVEYNATLLTTNTSIAEHKIDFLYLIRTLSHLSLKTVFLVVVSVPVQRYMAKKI